MLDIAELARLNLTVANRLHIVEPQWNPATEDQAIGRALRMGRKREVVIYRYLLRGTVEDVSTSCSTLTGDYEDRDN